MNNKNLDNKDAPQTQCRHFSGYKPCSLSDKCDANCVRRSIAQNRILIIHLGALGAVVRSTALLSAIHRKFSAAHITWVTQNPADKLLSKHPLIDRILTTERDDLLALTALEFDVAFCIDKSLVAGGILSKIKVKKVYGFQVDAKTGAILPATDAANELWEIGLSNHKKFFVNKKPETQLIAEALELPFQRSEYNMHLTVEEVRLSQLRRAEWALPDEIIVGLNTGCSGAIPYKKLTVQKHRELIFELQKIPRIKIVLLGGKEDFLRNQQISYGLGVVSSSTGGGLRDGLISVNACDIVVSGDSLGMHMSIALKKWTVAWFGPTCAHEIDLYERGVKVLSGATCGPCWKRACHNQPMCYDLVDVHQLVSGVKKGIQWLMLSFTPPLLATSSCLSRSCDISGELPPTSI